MKNSDELKPVYDFATMKGGVRGKYAEAYRKGTNLVLLEPDIAEAFPTAEAVNEALRKLLEEADLGVETVPPNKGAGADKNP